MDEHTFRVLEFEKILHMAATFAVTSAGKQIVYKIKPLSGIEDIRRNIGLVTECRRLLAEGNILGIEHYEDLKPLFRRIRPADAVLEPVELRLFIPLFHSALNLRIWSESVSFPGIGAIVKGLITHPDLRRAIDDSIDREGKIRDEASSELYHIRREIKSSEKKIKGILDGLLNKKALAPHLQDFYITQRNNRWVIPLKRDSKGSVPGVVHDISNSGETVFVEPFSVQLIANDLESYRAEEKLEMYRILQRLCLRLRENLQEIEEDYSIVTRVDSLQALAGFAEYMAMSAPEINESGYLNIIKGRHPLLWKTLKRNHREQELVPLDLKIGRDKTCMVITGSNAGGKTVALKTLGILNLMALSGMHIPAGSGTNIPFLRAVLADIGDEQSIEQNLSTFSAHITRLSQIISNSGGWTLVIIDELGTGTDPEEGGALSCAILRRLRQKRALTVVSTHLGILKAFAHSEPGLINSSMEMEEIKVDGISPFKPTYKLSMGEPGTSHAFEIAESLGLNEDIVKEARGFMAGKGAQIESLISELKQKNRMVNEKLRETEEMKREVDNLRLSMEKEVTDLKFQRNKTLEKALREAEEIVRKTRTEARGLIENLKNSELSARKKVINDLDEKHSELKKELKLYSSERTQKLEKVRKGQRVFIDVLGVHGTVHSVDEKAEKCKILVHGKEAMVPLTELSEPIAKPAKEKPAPSVKINRDSGRYIPAETDKDVAVSSELNIVGQRVDPAISLVERYLNDATLAGLQQVKIIHGIGKGTLARAVREYLKSHPIVKNMRSGDEDEGGEAVTIVFF